MASGSRANGDGGISARAERTALSATISVERAGEILGVSRRSAYRAAARGQIPTVRVGRRLLVPTAEFLRLLGLPSPIDVAGVIGSDGGTERSAESS